MAKLLSRLNIFPAGAPPVVRLRGSVIAGLLHFSMTIIILFFAWKESELSETFLSYYKYRGLIWIILDNWQGFFLVLTPAALMVLWRGRVNAQRMVFSKRSGLWIFIDAIISTTIILVLFITIYIVRESLFSSWNDLSQLPAVVLMYIVYSCVLGIIIAIPIYLLNLLWVVLDKLTRK